MVCKQILHYKCYIYSIETAHLDSEISVAYIDYKVIFVTTVLKRKKEEDSKLVLGNDIAAMKKTYYYDTNTETMWLSYRLLYSLQHHLHCWRLCCWKENHLELRTTSRLSYSGGRVQYKFVISKLHCKLNFMSTFVSEGNSVRNCQVLIFEN